MIDVRPSPPEKKFAAEGAAPPSAPGTCGDDAGGAAEAAPTEDGAPQDAPPAAAAEDGGPGAPRDEDGRADAAAGNAKKRSSDAPPPGRGDPAPAKPRFADIVAEQEREARAAPKAPPSPRVARVSFQEGQVVEDEEDRQLRLAIEASLRDQGGPGGASTFDPAAPTGDDAKMPPPALRNPGGGGGVAFSPAKVGTSDGNVGDDDDMDEDMRRAIALSLRDAGEDAGGDGGRHGRGGEGIAEGQDHSLDGLMDELMGNPTAEEVEESCREFHRLYGVADDGAARAASTFEAFPAVAAASGASKPPPEAAGAAAKPPPSFAASATAASKPPPEAAGAASKPPPSFDAAGPATKPPPSFDAAGPATKPPPSFAMSAAAKPPPPAPGGGAADADSESLARALHHAELAERDASQSASAAAEAASLKLAMALQAEEDAAHHRNSNRDFGTENEGVRTVGREEFRSLKGDGDGAGGGRMADRRKMEERGVGRLLSAKGVAGSYYDEGAAGDGTRDKDMDDYYYYARDRLGSHDAHGDDDAEEDDDGGGIRMNSQSSSSAWKRLDKDTFVGPNDEIRTKHDPELKHRSNAADLLHSHGAKLKDAEKKSVAVSDRAYNAFKRAEKRQTGSEKGVARQGHGRAEDAGAGKTRGGAMDGNVRACIAAAINAGLIDRCNGAVKEGKEAMVYHADGGWKGRGGPVGEEGETSSVAHYSGDGTSLETIGNDGYDVAVKVFKRIAEFKGRGSYVDGDPRYHKQKFKTNDNRNQVVLWTEKEYRNLIRAYRAGVAVPKPLYLKENVLFLRFLGEDGWPSPQLKEIEVKRGSAKWTTFYFQVLVSVRKLFHCTKLVHADLSEYNILVCPAWQASCGRRVPPGERAADDEALQAVLIDFGQAVEVGHPSAAEWLRRDLATVRDFFARQGIATLSNEDAERFVTDPVKEAEDAKDDAATTGISEMEVDSDPTIGAARAEEKQNSWRHAKVGWDDKKEMDSLLQRLQGKG